MASSAKLLHTDDLLLWYATRISTCSSADLPPPDSVPCDPHEKSAFSRKLASDAGPSRNVGRRLAGAIYGIKKTLRTSLATVTWPSW